jgi:ADP-ribosylglycohydrolase
LNSFIRIAASLTIRFAVWLSLTRFSETATLQVPLADAQAAVSHNHPDAIAAAQAVALGIFLARRGLSADALRRRLEEGFGYDLTPGRPPPAGRFAISAKGTVTPALTAVLSSETWESAVRSVISAGGDTDTLGCIAGAMSEAIHGVPTEIAALARSYLTEDLQSVLDRFMTAIRS